MSSPQKSSKPASRWAFLSQAVASVESGLDKILADEEDTKKRNIPKNTKSQEDATSARVSSEITRSSESTQKTNDRLQARLAQAMVKKGGSRVTSPGPTPDPSSRPATPQPDSEVVQTSQLLAQVIDAGTEEDRTETTDDGEAESADLREVQKVEASQRAVRRQSHESLRRSREPTTELTQRPMEDVEPSIESTRSSQDVSTALSVSQQFADPDKVLLNAQLQHEKSLTALQEEISGYLERIDALQRNIQMLTKETLQNAKTTMKMADATSHDKQLAEKDEKIALLIEEGMKLTKGEMQYRNTIKKLRTEATTLTKDQEAARQRAHTAEKSVAALEARASKAEAEVKRHSERIADLSKTSTDVDLVSKERDALNVTLTDVREQLSKANTRAENAEAAAASEKLEIEQKRSADLQDDLSNVKMEKQLLEEKLRREIEDLRQSLALEKEQTRQMETEMLAEQATLESKLEAFRVRAEEASTGDQGDSQAKLLRQIETLQSQYAAASQNWQGIESTLLTRITALEKERDEVVGRETDLRRKLKDATTRARNASKELEDVQQNLHTLQDQRADESAELSRAMKRVEQFERDTANLRKELEDQKLRAEKDVNRRVEEERVKWMASINAARLDSPVASIRRGMGISMVDGLMSPIERPNSRRSSTHPFHELGVLSPQLNSAALIRANGHTAIPETPSIVVGDDQDDFFQDVPPTPASGTHADSTAGRNINEVISASTGGAGPSVQLVERMSANVRRLESEKAASKDEIARLSSQRDGARQQVVDLMREIEQKRTADTRLAALEKDHKELSEKHRATLELLGEKTELVEELKADILDVKQMYRHLADTMGKT